MSNFIRQKGLVFVCFIQIFNMVLNCAFGMDAEGDRSNYNSLLSHSSGKNSRTRMDSESEREEFHIFGVGQGNAQLAVYERSKFAVIYDCGSNSQQVHPKIDALTSEMTNDFYFKRKNNQPQESQYNDIDDQLAGIRLLHTPSSIMRESPSISFYSNESSTKYKRTEENILETIKKYRISNLLIFLSHPDADHINLISNKTIPDSLNIYAFLGGDWFRQESKDGEDLTDDVHKVLTFLFNRRLPNRENVETIVELPYYWGLGQQEGKTFFYNDLDRLSIEHHYLRNYKELKNYLQGYTNEKGKKLYNFFKKLFPPNNPLLFHGSLLTLLQTRKIPYYPYEQKVMSYINGTPIYSKTEKINIFTEDQKKDLENVYIISMNERIGNVNADSILMRFTMPSLEINFFCTGDAEDDSFHQVNLKKNLFFQENNRKFLNFVVLPHHGSAENLSQCMLESTNPDFLLISCGNGKQYGHPDIDTIKYYKSAQEYKVFKSRFFDWFEAGFMKGENKIIAFKNKTEARKTGQLVNLKNIPIMSTNIHSTVTVAKGGIISNYSDVIIVGDEEGVFEIDISKRVADEIENKLQAITTISNLLSYENIYYYKILDDKYYKATKIDN